MKISQRLSPDSPSELEGIYGRARGVVGRLQETGHEAYFAGGWVRDRLLGRTPCDIDIATSATPDQVEALFERTFPMGKAFGVIGVMIGDDELAVATFRADGAYSDGRRPDAVRFADAREDALRRDFTINGMFYDPIAEKLHDWVGGVESLEKREIRCIGDPEERLAEDRLRLLRAVRFAAQLGFAIEPATLEAIGKAASSISTVSAERIGEELDKTLLSPNPRVGLELMQLVGLLKEILPEVDAMHGVEQGKAHHPEGDVYEHTLRTVENLAPGSNLALAWAALLHDVAKPRVASRREGKIRFFGHTELGATMAREIGQRLRFPNNRIEKIERLIRDHLIFIEIRKMRESRLKRRLADPDFLDLLELHRLDAAASNRDFSAYEFCKEKLREYPPEALDPPAILTGSDLIALGYAPGPAFKEILEWVRAEQLENRLLDAESARRAVTDRFQPQPKSKERPR